LTHNKEAIDNWRNFHFQ